ncbi:hypothetical protein F3Y22_tig00111812pilonHSYRG00063 [Hibiscus syriacus]|uniref:CCHC-type domain-containing protein n=1 Tax=Hibiscus syriacus TaxID=106335 RepID=A0A6A2XZU0_HIBSY|nr:hypothetical protein F3Y22_tig00111812pilonHSYRG00063 [Hibiscus syriacus]
MAADQPGRQSWTERKQKGACYTCGKPGHWASDCPSNHRTARASSSSPPPAVWLAPFVFPTASPTMEEGAGACTVNIRRDENGKETKYNTFRIRTGHGAFGFLLLDTAPSPANSWPRSTKMDKRPPTLSPQYCGLPNIKTCQISAAGNGYFMPFSYTGNVLRGIVFSVSMPDAEVNEVPQNALRNGMKTLGVPLRTSNLETAFTAMEEEGTFCRAPGGIYSGISIVARMGPTLQVHEAAYCIKDALCQIEKLETHLLKTAMDVGQAKRCIQATYQELTKLLETSTGETRANALQQGQQ